jgi:hypothetical protein
MKTLRQKVFVEIIAKKKGCMLCDLALGILEENAFDNISDFESSSAAVRKALMTQR